MKRGHEVVLTVGLDRLFRDILAAALSAHSWRISDDSQRNLMECNHAAELALIPCDADVDSTLAVIRRTRVKCPSAKLVLMGTGHDDAEVVRFIGEGAAVYVDSRQSLADLVSALDMVSNDRSASSPRVRGLVFRSVAKLSRELACGLPCLTQREREVLRLLSAGLCNKEIAEQLCIAVPTVKRHVHHVFEKLAVSSRLQLVRIRTRPPGRIAIGASRQGR